MPRGATRALSLLGCPELSEAGAVTLAKSMKREHMPPLTKR
jgi:hypothetical protein